MLQSAPWGQTEAAELLNLHFCFPSTAFLIGVSWELYLNKSLLQEPPSQVLLEGNPPLKSKPRTLSFIQSLGKTALGNFAP